MNPCVTCGREVRLRAMRVSLNRKRGVAHWFELADGSSCVCLKAGWTHIKSDKSTHVTPAKIEEWNAANPITEPASEFLRRALTKEPSP